MKKKKIVSIVLCICLFLEALLFMGTITSAAAETAWDGSSDIAWYNAQESDFHLSTAEQLAGLAELVNNGLDTFQNKTIYLENDLDLNGHDWISIGTGSNHSKYFSGTFDGQNHCIYNLTSINSADSWYGLFGIISMQGTVKNLGIVDADLRIPLDRPSGRMGILADWANNSNIINCYTTGSAESAHNVGGFVLLGGLVGQATGNTRFIGCYSTAAVESRDLSDPSNNPGDTVGGLIGQWENAGDEALISDCWFGGKISSEFTDYAVGGILGANFDFGDNEPGVTIHNCMVTTTDITCAQPENITYIAAVVNGPVTNCYWPVDTTLEEPYAAVVKLVVNWDAGTAGPDPDFDQSACGEAVTDFIADQILTGLNANANSGVNWVKGIKHPVFDWDTKNISADYRKVTDALEKVPKDLSIYTEDSVEALYHVIETVDYELPMTDQAAVNGFADAIENAIKALVYKNAVYTAVDDAISNIPADFPGAYTRTSAKALTDAVNAVDRSKNITEQEIVNNYAQAIEAAISALVYKPQISKFEIAGCTLEEIDHDQGIITFTAPYGTNLKILPEIETTGANYAPKGILDFSNPVVFTVHSSDGEIKFYTVSVELIKTPANYDSVDAALARIPDDLSVYTNESVKALRAAEDAVIQGMDISEQELVNRYAQAIEDAIDALEYKPLITGFAIPGCTLQTIDQQNNIITLTAPYGTNLKAAPAVEIAGADYAPKGVMDFNTPVVFTVVSTGGRVKAYTVMVEITGAPQPADPDKPVEPETIIVQNPLTTLSKKLTVGQKAALRFTVTPANAVTNISWKSSNSKIVSVDKNGVATAHKAGKVTITATTSNGLKSTGTITVRDKISKVKFKKSVLKVKQGKSVKLKSYIKSMVPKKKEYQLSTTMKWYSSNKKAVTINKSNGTIKALKAGKTAKITVKNGKKVLGKIKIKVTK